MKSINSTNKQIYARHRGEIKMSEGKKEREEEMEQLTHDLAMGFMRQNADVIQGMMKDKLPEILDEPDNQLMNKFRDEEE